MKKILKLGMKLVLTALFALLLLTITSCAAGDLGQPMYVPSLYPNANDTGSVGTSALYFANGYFTNINGAPYSPGGVPTLTDGHIFVGSTLNVATDKAVSGDTTLINTGALTVIGIQGHGITLPLSTGYLKYDPSGGGSWSFGTGGSGITSVDTGTPSNITGILTGNGLVLGSITNNSANWNTAYSNMIVGTPWTGMGYITGNQSITLGGILSGSGTTSITASAASGYYMPSTSDQTAWNAKQAGSSILSGLSSLSYTSGSPFVTMTGAGSFGLNSTAYESVSALGSWAGSANVTTLGTVTTGTLQGITLQGTISSGSGLTFGNFTAGTITAALSGNATTATSAGSVTGLSVTAGKTLTVSNSLTLSGTDGSTLAIGTGGTLGTAAYTASTAYSPAAGSGSITTVGAIGSGTWQGDLVIGTYGGTGVNNGSSTITIGGNFSTTAGDSLAFTLSGATTITLPTSGTMVTSTVTSLSNLVGVGTLTSGATGSGFTVALGTSTITGLLTGTYGGTGINNSTRTITLNNGNIVLAPPAAGATLTLGGSLTTSGAFATTFTMSAGTSVTFPTSGTLATLLGTESLAAKTIVQASNDFPKTTVLAANTAGVMTFTAAQLIGGLIVRTAMGAARSDVTDSAANIIAAIPNYVVGTSFEFGILNQTATYTETLTAGSGVTITGTATTATLCYHRYLAVITSASAVTIYSLGTATY